MIDTYQALSVLCSRMEQSSCIALDTEFISGRRTETILSIIQVGLGADDVHLIDVLAFDDLSILRSSLESENIVKILHDAGQDLGLIATVSGASPRNIFDIKLAARLLGRGENYSLSEIVWDHCGVRLSKGQQRSNWLRRPLSPAQIEYAMKDVVYLPEIREALLMEAGRAGRSAWLEEDMRSFDEPISYRPLTDAERILNNVAAYNLDPRQRAVVVAIADWRVRTAKEVGALAKEFLRDRKILKLVKRRCHDPDSIRAFCPELSYPYCHELARLIVQARQTPVHECPAVLALPPLTDRKSVQLHLLQAVVGSRAIEHGIEAELIGTTSVLKDFLLNPENTSNPLRRGWRWDVAGADLVKILRGEHSVALHEESLTVYSYSV